MARLHCSDAVELPALEQQAAGAFQRAGQGQIVGPVADKYVLRPELRESTIVLPVVKVHHVRAAIGEILRIDATRIVDRSRECVGKLRSKSPRELLLGTQQQRVIERLRIGDPLRNAGKVRIHASQVGAINLDPADDRERRQRFASPMRSKWLPREPVYPALTTQLPPR